MSASLALAVKRFSVQNDDKPELAVPAITEGLHSLHRLERTQQIGQHESDHEEHGKHREGEQELVAKLNQSKSLC